MIVFDLICSNGHSFEVWFNSNNDYKEQNDKGLLICPYCEVIKITKNYQHLKLSHPTTIKIKKKILYTFCKKFLDYIEKNTENVGKKFPEIARKIQL